MHLQSTTLDTYNLTCAAERFWSYVQKTESCWLWTGARDADGYGRFRTGGSKAKRMWNAHRFAWTLTYGLIPKGRQVLHNCPDGDNPSCVNPAHLWLGDQKANIQDCWRKGRHKRRPGELSPVSKLTADQVLAIRAARDAGVPGTEVARLYGISVQHVCTIFKRRTWRHLP